MNIQANGSLGSLTLGASDFLVSAEEFVRRCAKSVGAADLEPVEVELLATAIRNGASKLDVLDVLIARIDPLDPRLSRPNPSALTREIDSFVVADLLERYSADDDREFARFAYDKILGEAPAGEELDAAQGQLLRSTDRRGFLETLVARKLSRGYRAEISPQRELDQPQGQGLRPIGGAVLQPNGHRIFIVVRHEPGMGWATGDNVLVNASIQDGKWKTHSGWVVVGPKRSFQSGLWRLNVHLIQPKDAAVVLDVVANAGMDVLAKASLLGSANLSLRLDIKDWHHFIEVRLFKPQEPPDNNALDIRDISLVRIS